MKQDIKTRDYYFDNIKAIMIFFVVFGHFMELGFRKNELFDGIWYAIYLFHMPIFIFVTGYFTKVNQDNVRKAIKNYLIPYIIFSTILYIFKLLILKQDEEFQLLVPQYGMWFLLTLFWYKIIYNGIYKIKGLFAISVILAIIVGLDPSFEHLGSFSRTIVFLPFFIAGTKFKKEYLIQDKKWLKGIFFILIFAILISFGYICLKLDIPTDLLRGSTPYELLDMKTSNAIIARICILLLSFITSYMILNIIPNKKLPISYIGKNTILTYISHIFLILFLRQYNILDVTKNSTILISIILTILIVFITSLPIFKKIYELILDKISKLIHIEC